MDGYFFNFFVSFHNNPHETIRTFGWFLNKIFKYYSSGNHLGMIFFFDLRWAPV